MRVFYTDSRISPLTVASFARIFSSCAQFSHISSAPRFVLLPHYHVSFFLYRRYIYACCAPSSAGGYLGRQFFLIPAFPTADIFICVRDAANEGGCLGWIAPECWVIL